MRRGCGRGQRILTGGVVPKVFMKTRDSSDIDHADAPPLAPRSIAEMPLDAHSLLELMQGEPPDAVAVHAGMLANAARSAGELEIAAAADRLHTGATLGAPRRP